MECSTEKMEVGLHQYYGLYFIQFNSETITAVFLADCVLLELNDSEPLVQSEVQITRTLTKYYRCLMLPAKKDETAQKDTSKKLFSHFALFLNIANSVENRTTAFSKI